MSEQWNPSPKRAEFDRLYLEYKPKLLQYVIATIENRNIAEDVVQETFYEALRKYDTFSTHPHQIGWLYRTAGFKIKECLRKLEPQDEICVEPEEIEICDCEEGYCETETEMVICDTLTEDELLRFRRYFLWGESTAEIARKENITEKNMRVRLSRLKQKIEVAMRQG